MYDVARVSVNAQTDVFTSVKILQNVQNLRAGREYISSFSCLRPFLSGRTYVHQALGLFKYYFVHMEISLPGLPVEAVLCLAQDTNVNVNKVRTNYMHIWI